MPDTIRLISGTANPEFTQKIYQYLKGEDVKSRIIEADIGTFPDGETRVQISETVRGYHIYVVQPTCPPVNNNLMELCEILDALKRASARSKTAVIPYYGYSRQEKKGMPRVPITAKLVAKFIEEAGADRVVAMDLHSAAIQGFFEIPVDNLESFPVFAKYFEETLPDLTNAVIVSPDVGGTARARSLAERIGLPLAVIQKRRDEKTGKSEVFNVIGEVRNKIVILLDDIISSGKTLIDAAELLYKQGAQEIWSAATHGIFSGKAIKEIETSRLKQVVVADTIALHNKPSNKIKQVSVAKVFTDTIRRIHENRSVSAIFKKS